MKPNATSAPMGAAEITRSAQDALRHLGWAQLCEHLARDLRSGVAREQISRDLDRLTHPQLAGAPSLLFPETDLARARARLAELDGFELLDRAESQDPGDRPSLRACLGRVEDLGETLEAARSGAVLETIELWAVGELLEAAEVFDGLVEAARDLAHRSPGPLESGVRAGLEALLERVGRREFSGLIGLGRRLGLSLRIEGGRETPVIADGASLALKEAREEVETARRRLLTLAQREMRSAFAAKVLQDRYWTERDGRVVLPVRSDALGNLRRDGRTAIIHGSSGSGQTLYVEPQSLVEGNNQRQEAQARVEAEEYRVRQELSERVGAEAIELARLQDAMVALDVVQARLALSLRLLGRPPGLVAPAPGGDKEVQGIELYGAKHPLMVLDGVDVVPNDIVLEHGHALIISGPNAGGKTVALKTLGLCLLMARAGLRLPTARPGRLPLYAHVVTDVGDDQSITANLSTFSAHLGHVMSALRLATSDGASTLVLLDEVAVGTDPEQGAALAEAILLELVGAGATVVATTHYDRLKLLASRPGAGEQTHGSTRFHNAAVGFDLENLRPTFRLTTGIPGSSSAIAVARRLGMSEAVLGAAQSLLGDERLRVDVLLQGIDAERHALAEARRALETEKQRLVRRDREVQLREQRALDGARSRKRKAYDAAADELHTLERELKVKRKRLRRDTGTPDPLPTRDEAVGGERARIQHLREPPVAVEAGAAPASIEVGMRVQMRTMRGDGEVISLRGKKVTLQVGGTRLTMHRDQIIALHETPAKVKVKRAKGRALFEFEHAGPKHSVSRHFGAEAVPVKEGFDNACDLRGTRAEDAGDVVEDFLAEALMRDQDVVILRHGHGSGALRKVLREHLRRLPHVRRHRGGLPVEGGDAITVVELGTLE